MTVSRIGVRVSTSFQIFALKMSLHSAGGFSRGNLHGDVSTWIFSRIVACRYASVTLGWTKGLRMAGVSRWIEMSTERPLTRVESARKL